MIAFLPGEETAGPLRYPGFPVETHGFDDLHAALFAQSHTRGRDGFLMGDHVVPMDQMAHV
jgi:hypothetical protein